MRHNAAHPPAGPKPPPGTPPGPYDPPSPPPAQKPNPPGRGYADNFPAPANLQESALYPGLKTFHPAERCTHRATGTPTRAINTHQ